MDCPYVIKFAQVAELVDAIDSKSIDGNIMRVRFSPWALRETFVKLEMDEQKQSKMCGKNAGRGFWILAEGAKKC